MFSVTYNGLTINTSNYPTNGISIHSLGGIDGLGIRVSAQLLTGQDGGVIFNRLYGMRNIYFEGWVKGSDADEYFANLKALCLAFSIADDQVLTMTRWGDIGATKSIQADVIQMPMTVKKPGEVNFCEWRVELQCGDPFFGDGVSTDYSITLPIGGGTPVEFAVPSMVGGLNGGVQVINNTGDLEVYPVKVRFTGLINTPSLMNSTTGGQMGINTIIPVGSYVDIYRDQTGLTVSLNGLTNYYQYLTGEFFKLSTGNNTLRFGASGYSASGVCTITWSNKFMTL